MLSASVFAAGPELRPDHPDQYVVKRGDTLWDISAKFLKSPWYWPEIWQANPQIENPHLIYPGDVISLVYIDGKPHLVINQAASTPAAAQDTGPRMRDEGPSDAIAPVPLSDIKSFLDRPRILTEDEFMKAPYVVALEEDRLRGTGMQLAYVRQLDPAVAVGTRYVVARPTLVYTEVPERYPWQGIPKKVVAETWSRERVVTLGNFWHWAFRNWAYEAYTEVLGYELLEIGSAVVARHAEDSKEAGTVYLSYSDMEVKAGDLLVPVEEEPFDLSYVPHAPKAVPENMRVIAFTDAFNAVGPRQVVVLSKGDKDGIENGQVYSLWQPGEKIRDRVGYPEGDLKAWVSVRKRNVVLPEEFIGHVMIFRTFHGVSYGLVMNAVKPVNLKDVAREPTEL